MEAEQEMEEDMVSPVLMEVNSLTGRAKRSSKSPKATQGLKRKHRRTHGYGISPRPVRRVQQRLPSPRLTGAASTLTRANVRCVLCQFIAQKLKNALTAGSVDPNAAPAPAPMDAGGMDMGMPAGEEPMMMLEALSFASAADKLRIEATVESAARADAAAQTATSAMPSLFESGRDASKRFRHTDLLAHRATRARFTQTRANQPGPDTDATRAAYLRLYASVYASFEGLCARNMPLAYLPYCNDMLKSYRFFAQGVNYGDRADQICMNGNFCDHRSYVRRVPHATYQREPGDA